MAGSTCRSTAWSVAWPMHARKSIVADLAAGLIKTSGINRHEDACGQRFLSCTCSPTGMLQKLLPRFDSMHMPQYCLESFLPRKRGQPLLPAARAVSLVQVQFFRSISEVSAISKKGTSIRSTSAQASSAVAAVHCFAHALWASKL